MIPDQDSYSNPGSTKRQRVYDPDDLPKGPLPKISKTSLGSLGDTLENQRASRLEVELKETLQVKNSTLYTPSYGASLIIVCALSNSTLFSWK